MLNKLKSIKDQTTCASEVEHISSKMESVADRLNKFHEYKVKGSMVRARTN